MRALRWAVQAHDHAPISAGSIERLESALTVVGTMIALCEKLSRQAWLRGRRTSVTNGNTDKGPWACRRAWVGRGVQRAGGNQML